MYCVFDFSQAHLVVQTHHVHIDYLLLEFGHPIFLTLLSLSSHDLNSTSLPRRPDILLRFPNLTHLALCATSLPTSSIFYESLRRLPLEFLHFGYETSVRIQLLIDLFSNTPRITTMKRLTLDNIAAYAPTEEEEDEANLNDWVLPVWTDECSEEKVWELKRLAEQSGIETRGETFLALSLVDSEAYRAALKREEERNE